jgi:DNA-binding beta-propeller fold protein YncE
MPVVSLSRCRWAGPISPRPSALGPIFALGIALGAFTAGPGCSPDSPKPPEFDPYFPASMALSADERWLFLVNANSDLSFGAGSAQVWDVDAIAALVPGDCAPSPDTSRPELRVCPSTTKDGPAAYAKDGVQIGNFAADIAVQTLTDGRLRLFATVRGDPSVTWIDFDPAAASLSCGGAGGYPRCDEAHRLDTFRNDTSLGGLQDEPFGVAVDAIGGRAVVSHLTSGDVSLLLAPQDGGPPVLADRVTGIWAPGASTQAISAAAVAARVSGDPQGYFYVTSRNEARVNLVRAVSAADPDGAPSARLVRGTSFFYSPGPPINGADGFGQAMRFSADGTRMFLVTRTPSRVSPTIAPTTLTVVDTSLGPSGQPKNVVVGSIEICGQPMDVDVVETGGETLAYVPCFASGEVWVVDGVRLHLVDTIAVGRGPAAIAVARSKKRAFVANYGEDTVSVIDLDPASPGYHHAVLELGKKRTL